MSQHIFSIPADCRSRRRKCTWEKGEKKCERCFQTGAICIPYEKSDTAGVLDGNKQLLEWWDRTSQLEDVLNSAQEFVHETSRALIPKHDQHHYGEKEQRQQQQQEPQWTLSVVNGRVRLESNIRDYEELLKYHQASIRYLSPLAGLLQRESFRFEGISASVAIASTSLIFRHLPPHTIQRPLAIPLPSCTFNYRQEMDQLIRLYMDRYNVCVGILHERTFMNYYHRLKDPLTSPVAMGICIDAIAYFYPQLKYTPLEKRQLAEYFYGRCRDMLLDMYEDPSRRLEAVMTTSFLMQYLQDVLMQYAEARRLVTVALLICKDLEIEMYDKMTDIELVMYRRHYVTLLWWERIIDIFLEGKFNFSDMKFVDIKRSATDLLDGETDSIRQYLTMWHVTVRLIGGPYVTTIMKQISLAVLGQPYELSLDMILQFETILREWWKSLPGYFQICEDPLSPSIYQVVDTVTSSIVLMPFALLHSISALIQSTLLKPPITSRDDTVTDDMIRIIQEKAVAHTLTSIKVLVHIIKRNLEIDVEAIPLSIGYMMGTLHAVCSVVDNSADIQLPPDVLDLLFRCFTQISASFPSGHMIDPSTSSLESFLATFKGNPIDLYQKFPMPGYAMVSDVFFTCFNRLERGVLHLAL
ncbi:hypothetical protein BDA99DRAFT_39301 [Phascolomyces articulosus]|uniref:Zn(2)-C6 fungal-type domain-containing protein n=1 Tax=Phascolomyces articulosus TaxID=60185 RepID=A0AAD5K1J3_9FUNG|nr:hypothetical protein BDA99DRAFT_39301 [Phascolomyces articulosus]